MPAVGKPVGWTPLVAQWAARGGSAWLEHYWASWSAPHRSVIVRAFDRLGEFRSVVEIGSHCGPNIRRLSSVWPAAFYLGLDVNPGAVAYGQRMADEGRFGAPNKRPSRVAFEQTHNFGLDKPTLLTEHEVVLSCYALAYAAPGAVAEVFSRIKGGMARALVLAEPLDDGAIFNPPHPDAVPEYRHDLLALISETWPGARIHLDEVRPPADRLATVLTVEVPS